MSALGIVLSLPTIAETIAASRAAEAAGLDSVWTTELPDRSAIAASNQRVSLVTA